MTIRVAATGVGHWHSLFDAAYLKSLARIPGAQLVGVHDPDAALAGQRAAQLGGPPVFGGVHELLERTKPDFVVALGRHDAMAETAHLLLDAGVPFMMEKPMGLDAREVRGIADKAVAKRAFAAVPLFQRHHPFVAQARRMIEAGGFGPLSHFHFRSNRGSSARYVQWGAPWMLDPKAAGGGCLRNIGLHGVDLFLHLAGGDAEVAGAQLSSKALGQPVEDYATVILRGGGGMLGTIEVGNTFPGQGADGEWKLAGRDALLVQQGGSVRLMTAKGEQEVAEPPAEPLATIALRDILARFQAGQPPATGPEECWAAMRVVDDAYRIAAKAEGARRKAEG